MVVELRRRAYLPQAVFGVLTVGDFECWTLERPWLNNEPAQSCIPCGQYQLKMSRYHRGDYPAYEILNVPNRSRILIHIGNFVDDSLGCILLGKTPTYLRDPRTDTWQLAVPHSAATFREFMDAVSEPAMISIWNESGLGVYASR